MTDYLQTGVVRVHMDSFPQKFWLQQMEVKNREGNQLS